MLKKWLNNATFLGFGATYWFKRFVIRKNIPFIGGYVLNESCNLKCTHCKVYRSDDLKDPSFEEAVKGLDLLHRRGARLLAITGGEPMYWRDGQKDVEQLIQVARQKGFRRISLYTNGTIPLISSADTLFVSLDGRREASKKLRGDVYDSVIKNIADSPHQNIIINFTINSLNQHEIEPFCQEAAANKNIKGVFYYFHTPYYGRDHLFMEKHEKSILVKLLLDMKRRGLPVLNSSSALKAFAADSWKRPTNYCQVYAAGKVVDCCRAIGNQDACDNCGYLGYLEVSQIMKLHPSAIMAGFKYI